MSTSPRTSWKAWVSLLCGVLGVIGVVVAYVMSGPVYLIALLLGAILAFALGWGPYHQLDRSKESPLGQTLAYWGMLVSGLAVLVAFSLPSFCFVRSAAPRMQATNNLKQIALALHDYHSINGHLPPAAHRGKNGEPFLSWRVLILPYLECGNLYGRFHLDEPWDSPHNLTLLPEMSKVYASVGEQPPEPFMTFIQVVVGPRTGFEGDIGLCLDHDFPDGTSNTFLVMEGGEPVPWSKPVDLVYDPTGPLPALGGVFRGGSLLSGYGKFDGFCAAMADGSVRYFYRTMTSEENIRGMITRNGGEKVEY
jgi:hypothetical protein